MAVINTIKQHPSKDNTAFALNVLLFFIFAIGIASCQPKKIMKETEFKISEYEATYNNQKLPFGHPITDWEKVFGKFDRNRKSEDLEIKYSENFWDEKGLKLILDSETDNGMKYLDYDVKPTSDILHIYFKDVTKNIYVPYPAKKYYSKSFNLDGAEIKTGMTIKQINKNRKDIGLPEFYDFYESQGAYIDIFPKHGSGKKTNDDGMYFIDYEETEGKNRTYKISLFIDENVIEHIEIRADIHKGKVINQ
jgi:hypothetical protein